jgi:predicted nucleic acid-binding protein
MNDKVFIDTNVFIYLYSEDEAQKQQISQRTVNKYDCTIIEAHNIKQALEIHKRYGYKYFDCLMLTSALNSDCKYFITEDMADGQIIDNRLTIINIYSEKNIKKYLSPDALE